MTIEQNHNNIPANDIELDHLLDEILKLQNNNTTTEQDVEKFKIEASKLFEKNDYEMLTLQKNIETIDIHTHFDEKLQNLRKQIIEYKSKRKTDNGAYFRLDDRFNEDEVLVNREGSAQLVSNLTKPRTTRIPGFPGFAYLANSVLQGLNTNNKSI